MGEAPGIPPQALHHYGYPRAPGIPLSQYGHQADQKPGTPDSAGIYLPSETPDSESFGASCSCKDSLRGESVGDGVLLAVVYAALPGVPVANTFVVCCTPAVVCDKAGRYLRSQIQMNSVPVGGGEVGEDEGEGEDASHYHSGNTWNPWKVGG